MTENQFFGNLNLYLLLNAIAAILMIFFSVAPTCSAIDHMEISVQTTPLISIEETPDQSIYNTSYMHMLDAKNVFTDKSKSFLACKLRVFLDREFIDIVANNNVDIAKDIVEDALKYTNTFFLSSDFNLSKPYGFDFDRDQFLIINSLGSFSNIDDFLVAFNQDVHNTYQDDVCINFLFSGQSFQSNNHVGIAYVGFVCDNTYNSGIVAYDNINMIPLITVHELGHLFGALHDDSQRCGTNPGIMHPGIYSARQFFSTCSIEYMRREMSIKTCFANSTNPHMNDDDDDGVLNRTERVLIIILVPVFILTIIIFYFTCVFNNKKHFNVIYTTRFPDKYYRI